MEKIKTRGSFIRIHKITSHPLHTPAPPPAAQAFLVTAAGTGTNQRIAPVAIDVSSGLIAAVHYHGSDGAVAEEAAKVADAATTLISYL
ncbi:hypothetical protein AAC387_Pa10g1376 [Persea americana]